MENLGEADNKNMSLNLIAGYGDSDSDSDCGTPVEYYDKGLFASVGFSAMVLKNNIINACAHGPLPAGVNSAPEVEGSKHMIIDSSDNDVVEYQVTEYRDIDSVSGSSSSDSSDSDVDQIKDIEEASASEDDDGGGKAGKKEPPRVLGELGLEDLPPIEDLAISLPAQDTTPIGTVISIVDKLVIVRAYPSTPAVDIESVLFLDKGAKALGKVFDVFGPVMEPHYCVRFNSSEHVRARGVDVGADVYIAPRTSHTNYVFLTELMKMKGSDASWLNDVEPPPHQVDYSDDEEERRANRLRKEQRKQDTESQNTDTDKRKPQETTKKNQRPQESSSRFGNNSRNKNPFFTASRRNVPLFPRPWNPNFDVRPPPGFNYNTRFNLPPRPPSDMGPFAPPMFPPSLPMFPPPFNPQTPPPFMVADGYQFGGSPRMINPFPPNPFGGPDGGRNYGRGRGFPPPPPT